MKNFTLFSFLLLLAAFDNATAQHCHAIPVFIPHGSSDPGLREHKGKIALSNGSILEGLVRLDEAFFHPGLSYKTDKELLLTTTQPLVL